MDKNLNQRIYYVDAYRGLAAIAVAWFHIYSTVNSQIDPPIVFKSAALWGRWGVRLFFVISGFVLAFSLQRKYLIRSLPDIGKYFIKRSIRLDPTYWAALFITLLLLSAQTNTFIFVHAQPIENAKQLLANMFYLNWILNWGTIQTVSWTLALEIQLYLFFAVILYLASLYQKIADKAMDKIIFVFIAVTSLLSLLWPLRIIDTPAVFFCKFYYMFTSGVLLYNCFVDKKYYWVFIPFDITLLFCFFKFHDNSTIVVVVSHFLILAAQYIIAYRKVLEKSLFQYLGKLSYCIYVLHIPIGLTTGQLIVWGMKKTFGAKAWIDPFSSLLALGCTILFSHLLYWLVEKRSIELSRKIHLVSQKARN